MVEGENKNWTLEVVAIIVLCFIMWYKLRSKKAIAQPEPITTAPEAINANPLLDPYKGQPLNCDEGIISKPLAPYGPVAADFTVGKGYCYRGDGSFFDGKDVAYGDPYADAQAEAYSVMKQTEAVRNINKKVIQFRLINSTAVKAPVTVLDTVLDSAPFTPAPSAPVASAATAITSSGFTANWGASSGATGYYLDVATDSGFLSFVTGYNNLDVGDVLNEAIIGLNAGTDYYYRVRAYNTIGTSSNSETITVLTKTIYNDWFLPSRDELYLMYTQLKVYSVGDFASKDYWSSSEFSGNPAGSANLVQFGQGGQKSNGSKPVARYVRACRAFTSSTSYSVRDVGPAGGLIFYKSGNNYIEAAPDDQSAAQTWSSVVWGISNADGLIVGTGQANTIAIIAQPGHTDSAAKLCDDLVITN